MDFGIIDVVHPLDASLGVPPYEFYEPARYAMGDTRRYAERMSLVNDDAARRSCRRRATCSRIPAPSISCCSRAESGEAFTVTLMAGTYEVEWFNVANREASAWSAVTIAQDGAQRFSPPSKAGPWVLYLKR